MVRIGIISPSLPFDSGLKRKFAEGEIFWFAEIESAYAYLLSNTLDQIIINEDLVDVTEPNIKKYQTLMTQQMIGLTVSTAKFRRDRDDNSCWPLVHVFPKLADLFKDGELKTEFQPIVHLSGAQKIYGFECLSRLHYQQKPFAPDFLFNYAAEKLKVTNYDKICLMQALSLAPKSDSFVFLNVRPQTLTAPDFGNWFRGELKKNQLEPERLVIEVTEQYCTISEVKLSEECAAMKKMGIRFAIDDYGLGISNLNMVEVIEPSFIKIPGRFIKDSHQDDKKRKLIRNVLSLCQDFRIDAIVENVEQKEEVKTLTELGAKFAQGFYFYKPMERASLCKLIG